MSHEGCKTLFYAEKLEVREKNKKNKRFSFVKLFFPVKTSPILWFRFAFALLLPLVYFFISMHAFNVSTSYTTSLNTHTHKPAVEIVKKLSRETEKETKKKNKYKKQKLKYVKKTQEKNPLSSFYFLVLLSSSYSFLSILFFYAKASQKKVCFREKNEERPKLLLFKTHRFVL